MSKAVVTGVVSICLVLAAAPGLMADTAADEAAIRSQVETMWKQVAAKAYDGSVVHPDGAIQATSAGGFWESLSPAEAEAQINEAPTTLEFTPRYVEVRFLGASKDVAYVAFYLHGRIGLPDGSAIANYRTRASHVMEKVNGKWVLVGSHYSPLFGGSGVVLD